MGGPRSLLLLLLCCVLRGADPARAAESRPHRPVHRQPPLLNGRVVWLLWFEGWESAPWVVQNVARSWEAHNPGWTVQRLSRHNLADFIQVPYLGRMHELEELTHRGWRKPVRKWLPPAQSDVVRVHLLSKYGGVWADATLLCNGPLDEWVYPALAPAGFWSYRALVGAADGNGTASHACSWFLVATRHSRLLQLWREAVDEYWEGRLRWAAGGGAAVQLRGYFWLDALFMELLARDARASRDWAAVPALDCDAEDGPHVLGLSSHVRLSEAKRHALAGPTPPHALKLSRHYLPPRLGTPACYVRIRRCVRLRRTAAYEAVQLSLAAAAGLAGRGGKVGVPALRAAPPPPDSLLVSNCSGSQLAGQLSSLLAEVRRRARAQGGLSGASPLLIHDACTLCAAIPRTSLARCLPIAPLA